MMAATISEQKLAKLSTLVGRWTGLHFPKDRWTELERGIVRAAAELGHPSVEDFISRLMAQSLDKDQIQKLAWHLTIGETYFLRGKSAFRALEKKIIPRLVADHEHTDRHIRIWSAGCSGGEEAYSLAVMMARHITDVAKWKVTILATDINTQSLEKARRGIYGSWSFRDTPDWLRQLYFTEVQRDQWEVKPHIKKMVSFSYLNLALDPFPSLLNNTYAMDLIFCRNVMMYFSRDVMDGVVANLHQAVREGGYLFTAPSEASHEFFPQFAREMEHGEVYFRKDGEAVAAVAASKKKLSAGAATLERRRLKLAGTTRTAPTRTPATGKPAPVAKATRAKAPSVRRAAPVAPAAAAVAPAGPVTQAAGFAAEARANANRGHLDDALARCTEAIALDKLNAGYRYLSATILQELDRPDEAIKALNSALYLDRDYVLAHFLLGNIARGNAQVAESESHFGRALALLDALPGDTELPEADGLTAGRLAEIVAAILQTEAVS